MAKLPSDLEQSCLAVVEERHQGLISLAKLHSNSSTSANNDTGNEAYRIYLNQLTEIDHE